MLLGGEGPACIGATGAVTEVDRWGRQSRIVDRPFLEANAPGNDNAMGPHGITVHGPESVVHHQRLTDGAQGAAAGPDDPRRIPREELAQSLAG